MTDFSKLNNPTLEGLLEDISMWDGKMSESGEKMKRFATAYMNSKKSKK